MRMERTVREIAGDYAVLENESGGTTEVALALLPDGVREAWCSFLKTSNTESKNKGEGL
ncbi:MAG: hypothetical protein ACLUFI_04110 [Oscillospiraceae bacterium]